MLTEPVRVERVAQPFLALRTLVTMKDMMHVLPGTIDRLFRWIGENGIAPRGPLIFKYNVIDMDAELEIDIGVPVDASVTGSGDFAVHVIPGGPYLSITYFGPFDTEPTADGKPDGLYEANGVLIGWARDRGIAFDVETSPRGDVFGSRLEIYKTDIANEPDTSKWETEVAIRLADPGQ